MYLEHYGLTEAPFRITPHTDFFFSGANRGATLEALLYAITHDEGIVKISGEVGSGKTMLCRVLMERLPENVVIIYLANPSLSREDILYALADELGIAIPEQSRTSIVLRALQEKLVTLYAGGKQVVVLIDEAHAMPMETLEEIRLLSNLESNRHKLLQLVMFGQPEIDDILARTDMRQLRERITHNFTLAPLVREDIAQYLDFRMRAAGYRGPNVFGPKAIKLITEASQGLTRRINILADKALLASYAAGGHQVDAKEAKAAVRDSGFIPVRGVERTRWRGLAWALSGACVALGGVWGLRLLEHRPEGPLTVELNRPMQSPPPVSVTAGTPAAVPSEVAQPQSQAAPLPSTIEEPKVELPVQSKSSSPMLDQLLANSRPWLESAPSQHWFLQLFRSADLQRPQQVEVIIVRLLDAGINHGNLRAYRYQSGDTGRYGLIYGEYDSRKDAQTALDKMPEEIKRLRPYARQVARLRPEGNSSVGN